MNCTRWVGRSDEDGIGPQRCRGSFRQEISWLVRFERVFSTHRAASGAFAFLSAILLIRFLDFATLPPLESGLGPRGGGRGEHSSGGKKRAFGASESLSLDKERAHRQANAASPRGSLVPPLCVSTDRQAMHLLSKLPRRIYGCGLLPPRFSPSLIRYEKHTNVCFKCEIKTKVS